MKQIEEIINRQDYKQLNNALEERAIKLACTIRGLMVKMEVEELDGYFVDYIVGANFVKYPTLSVKNEYDNTNCSLEDSETYFLHGNYNGKVVGSSRKQKLKFLNHVKNLFEQLDKIQDEEIKNGRELLAETECFLQKSEEDK